MLDTVNQHVAKTLLAVEDGDSINRVSQKIGSSYGWTHNWVERLEELEVIERDNGIRIKDREFAEEFRDVVKAVLKRSIELEDAYLLPNFAGMKYRYTKTDAVFIWTKGGYQIGRNHESYPVFIDVLEDDVEEWQSFLDSLGITSSIEERPDLEGIHYVLFPRQEFEVKWFENAYVPPLQETVDWARKYEVNFQPALEMLDEMYDLGMGVEYSERSTL